jgi:hypothetical protein
MVQHDYPYIKRIKRLILIGKKVYDYYRYFRPFAKGNRNESSNDGTSIISIFSSPRSGSTWMSSILCSLPNSFLVWEPLYLNPPYPELKKVNICWDPYIPEDTDWIEAEQFFKKLYNREICSLRALRLYFENDLRLVSKAKFFIYKDVDSNMILPWLTKRFNINPIYIIRHPCAVVASQIKYKHWDWLISNPKARYYQPHCKYKGIYELYKDIYAKVSRAEERLAADWALHNIVPINHKENNIRWITVSYELLYKKPFQEIERIYKRLGLTHTEMALSKIRSPSDTAMTTSFDRIHNTSQLESWKSELAGSAVRNILNIVNEFGIHFYDSSPEPDYPKIFNSQETPGD